MDLASLRFAKGSDPEAGVRVANGVTIVTAARLQAFDQPGSLGVVTNTRFVRCFWPKLDRPTALFAVGSLGIEIQGPPTPRNIVGPDDIAHKPGTRGDCFFFRRGAAVAELTRTETDDLIKGRISEAALRALKGVA